MKTLKTLLFYLLLAIFTTFYGIICSPLLLLRDADKIAKVGYLWAKFTLLLLRYICGVKIREIGTNNIPASPFIASSKHQSTLETIFFITKFSCPSYVLKKELLHIPVFGWYLRFMGMICINRNSRSAIKQIALQAKKVFQNKRTLVIFPEGTRSIGPSDVTNYKSGIYLLHKQLPEIKILPIALNSAKVWHKSKFAIEPGTVTFSYLPPQDFGTNKAQFMHNLCNVIETEYTKL